MKKPLPNVSITEVWTFYGGEVVGRGHGDWLKALCPIHQDKTPSASVNEDAGKWNCRSCDLHGDAFDLIERMEPSVSGLAGAIAIAEGFAQRGDGPVRAEPPRSGLLPGGARSKRDGGSFVPPWRRL